VQRREGRGKEEGKESYMVEWMKSKNRGPRGGGYRLQRGREKELTVYWEGC